MGLRQLECLALPVYLYNLKMLRKELYISREAMREKQAYKLKLLIRHAYDNVKYYRKLFDESGIKPVQIKKIEDLKKMPITTRKQLQKHTPEYVVAKGMDLTRCHNYATSGATGVPLNIFVNKDESRLRSLFPKMVYLENGCSVKDKTLYITGVRHFGKKRLVHYLGIMRGSYISSHCNPDEILERICLFKPTILKGFVSSIIELALKVKKVGLKGIRIRKVFTTAEVLRKRERELISSIFQAEVFDYYSSNECDLIAWECEEHKGLHVNNSNIILEVVDRRGNSLPEGEGKIVVTNLSSFTMPFIRYETGDWGSLSNERCPCGRNSLLLKRILGRIVEFIKLPTKIINPYHHLTDIIDVFPGIEQYQVIQNNEKNIKIQIVKNDSFEEEKISQLLDQCSRVLDNSVDLEYEIVSSIPKSKSGKYKTVISHCNTMHGRA